MNPDDPDIFLPDNPKEYIPIRNKAFDQTLGKGFAEAYDKYKVLGTGAFGTTFQDPDDPTKVFKAQSLEFQKDIKRAEKEVDAQIKAAEMGRAPNVHAVETFPARKDFIYNNPKYTTPIIHVTEMDKVDTLKSQGYAGEPGGVLEKFVKNKGARSVQLKQLSSIGSSKASLDISAKRTFESLVKSFLECDK